LRVEEKDDCEGIRNREAAHNLNIYGASQKASHSTRHNQKTVTVNPTENRVTAAAKLKANMRKESGKAERLQRQRNAFPAHVMT